MAVTDNSARIGSSLALEPYPSPPAEARVRALIMGDDQGEVQVLVPETALLDVAVLRAFTRRALRARPYVAENPTAAIPGAYALPVVIDESLIQGRKLALATEESHRYVAIDGQSLMRAHYQVQVARFAEPLADMPADRDRSTDLDRIGSVVSRFTQLRMQQRLDQTLHIPPLPEAARRIIALQSNPNYDLADLVAIIETDPSIAARIMGWANSAFYNPNPPANSIGDAVMRVLGFDTVLSMALGMALGQSLRLPAAEVRGLPGFWLEAIVTAATMEALARQMPAAGRPEPGMCYLCGLLAGFGTLVLGHVFPHQHESICLLQEANRHLARAHADLHVLGLPREVLASALLETWELPDAVSDAVRFQQQPGYDGSNATYVRLLQLSRKLLGGLGLSDAPPDGPSETDLVALSLDSEALQRVTRKLVESRDALDGLAGSLKG
ncbi:MAG: HDOD domain-containing protein [Pseudomonadales bacterium]